MHYQLCDLPDYEAIREALREAGEYARANNHRLTAHPSEFVKLAGERRLCIGFNMRNCDAITPLLLPLFRHLEVSAVNGWLSQQNFVPIDIEIFAGQTDELIDKSIADLELHSQVNPLHIVLEFK